MARLLRTAKAALGIKAGYGGVGWGWYLYHHI